MKSLSLIFDIISISNDLSPIDFPIGTSHPLFTGDSDSKQIGTCTILGVRIFPDGELVDRPIVTSEVTIPHFYEKFGQLVPSICSDDSSGGLIFRLLYAHPLCGLPAITETIVERRLQDFLK